MKHYKSQAAGKKTVPAFSAILPSGDLVELIYNPENCRTAFAVGSAKGVSVARSVKAGGIRLVMGSGRQPHPPRHPGTA